MKNGNKGVTLIALVVTVIILLILAAVTIGILTDENFIGNAYTATDKWNEASDGENSTMDNYANVVQDLHDTFLGGNKIENSVENSVNPDPVVDPAVGKYSYEDYSLELHEDGSAILYFKGKETTESASWYFSDGIYHIDANYGSGNTEVFTGNLSGNTLSLVSKNDGTDYIYDKV